MEVRRKYPYNENTEFYNIAVRWRFQWGKSDML